jgi:rhodanese-related sulfurtransferase
VLAHDGRDKAVFTGDTLFIGDVGRPDLRESAGNITAKREELARQMYRSTRYKLMQLNDDVVVYPAHGAGTLCGKGLSEASSSTIGAEKQTNYALQPMSEEAFVQLLSTDQPFIPKYFGYDVALNKQGAPAFAASIAAVPRRTGKVELPEGTLIIDTRDQQRFKAGHIKGAINIQNGNKFETWLGSIVGPQEKYYLLADQDAALEEVIAKAAKIGYEQNLLGGLVLAGPAREQAPAFDLNHFRANPDNYTIVDIRNASEVKEQAFFKEAINLPLPELRERAAEISTQKPVVVHCAGGYRSAAGSSILAAALPETQVLDLSEAILEFKK